MLQDSVPSSLGEDDKADLTQRSTPETLEQVHWTQHQPFTCDPTAWLNSETLLPRFTIENLSKWTLYKEQDLAKSPRSKKALQGRWEAEDVTEDVLEMDMMQKQVGAFCARDHRVGCGWTDVMYLFEMPLSYTFQMYKDEDCYMEFEKVEDLSRLE